MKKIIDQYGKNILSALPRGAANRIALRTDKARPTVVAILNNRAIHPPSEETMTRIVEEIIVEIDAIDSLYNFRQSFKKTVEKEQQTT